MNIFRICIFLLIATGCEKRTSSPDLPPIVELEASTITTEGTAFSPDVQTASLKSQYDKTPLHYSFVFPKKEPTGIFLHLSSEIPTFTISEESSLIHLSIPSRPQFNYHWIAEGEFWQTFNHFIENQIDKNQLPTYLVALGSQSENALRLANYYRSSFSAVMIDQEPKNSSFPNLDSFPVIALLNSDSTAAAYISYLQERGNSFAFIHGGDLESSIEPLAEMKEVGPLLPRYTFFDDQFAQVSPFLKVTGRYSYSEPVEIEGEVQEEELLLTTFNCSMIEIDLEELNFPIHSVRLNGTLFTLSPDSKKVVIGEETLTQQWKSKIQTPSNFANFFRNEPVYIVYQDKKGSTHYLEQVYELAHKFAKFNFRGLPDLQANLPLIPLSKYQPDTLNKHRVILIGKEAQCSPFLFSSRTLYPLQKEQNSLSIYNHPLIEEETWEHLAYFMCYPSDVYRTITLGILLIAEDEKAMTTLDEFASSATFLFNRKDFVLWAKMDNEYQFIASLYFDSYWGTGERSSFTFPLPPIKANHWIAFLKETLGKETSSVAFITTSSGQEVIPPNQLNYNSLIQMIPDKRYASICLQGNQAAMIGNRIFKYNDDLEIEGLDPYIQWNNTLNRYEFNASALRKKVHLVVEKELLSHFTPQELSWLEYRLLPYSLQEVIWKKAKDSPISFIKNLQRSGGFNEQHL